MKSDKNYQSYRAKANFTKYVLSVIIHLITRITKRHNSYDTDPAAPIFLLNMHSLMVKVRCKFEQNRTKAIEVIEQNP